MRKTIFIIFLVLFMISNIYAKFQVNSLKLEGYLLGNYYGEDVSLGLNTDVNTNVGLFNYGYFFEREQDYNKLFIRTLETTLIPDIPIGVSAELDIDQRTERLSQQSIHMRVVDVLYLGILKFRVSHRWEDWQGYHVSAGLLWDFDTEYATAQLSTGYDSFNRVRAKADTRFFITVKNFFLSWNFNLDYITGEDIVYEVMPSIGIEFR